MMSQRGGYGSMMPRSHRFFSAIKYLLSPRRSSQRRQNASVPKFSLITFSRCLALGSLQRGVSSEKRESKIGHEACSILSKWQNQWSQPYWYVSDVEVLHVVRALHVVVDRAFSCAAKCFNGVGLTFLGGKEKSRQTGFYTWVQEVTVFLQELKYSLQGQEGPGSMYGFVLAQQHYRSLFFILVYNIDQG